MNKCNINCSFPGYYWIDPNLGSADDSMNVYCTKPGCSCVQCNNNVSVCTCSIGTNMYCCIGPEYQKRTTETSYKCKTNQKYSTLICLILFHCVFQIQCEISEDQLGLLQLLSGHAHQTLSYHCSSPIVGFAKSLRLVDRNGDSVPVSDSRVSMKKDGCQLASPEEVNSNTWSCISGRVYMMSLAYKVDMPEKNSKHACILGKKKIQHNK